MLEKKVITRFEMKINLEHEQFTKTHVHNEHLMQEQNMCSYTLAQCQNICSYTLAQCLYSLGHVS